MISLILNIDDDTTNYFCIYNETWGDHEYISTEVWEIFSYQPGYSSDLIGYL